MRRRKNGSKIETVVVVVVLNTYTTYTVLLFPDYQRVDTKGYE